MDFSTLQTRVQRRVIDLPSAVQSEVPDLINEAIRDIQDAHDFFVMQALQTTNTVLDTRVLAAAPADWKKPRGRPWYTTDSGTVRDMVWSQDRNMAEQAFGTSTDFHSGSPKALLLAEPDTEGQANIEIFPLPDGNSDFSDGEYRITVPYWRFIPDLSGGGDTNWFTSNAGQYIIWRATAEAFLLNWDERRAAVWMAKAGGYTPQGTPFGEFRNVINRDKRLWFGGITHLPVFTGAASPGQRSLRGRSGAWEVPDDLDVSSG